VRRQLIDLYTDKGFGLVIPPMVENIESLLLTSESVNKKTFKFLILRPLESVSAMYKNRLP
jgi:ATP phosphoribosyltransferase regulatory subunit